MNQLQDFYTLPQAAPLIGKGQATLYRWVKRGKIKFSEFGGVLLISYATIQNCRIKSCKNCYHSNNGYCACRELEDMGSPCHDWHPVELR